MLFLFLSVSDEPSVRNGHVNVVHQNLVNVWGTRLSVTVAADRECGPHYCGPQRAAVPILCVADRSIEKVYAPFYSSDEDLSHAYTITGQKHCRTHTGRSESGRRSANGWLPFANSLITRVNPLPMRDRANCATSLTRKLGSSVSFRGY